jgi:tRNA dimethylallyltransferase
VPHHLIDIAEPTDDYTAAHAARRGRGDPRDPRPRPSAGAGGRDRFYFRALTRGLFPGPGRGTRAAAGWSRSRRGAASPCCTGCCADRSRIGAAHPAARLLKRLVRALEVFCLTGRPLTAHFAETASPIPDVDVLAIGLRLPREQIAERVTRRVDQQFARGLLDAIRTLLDRGIPETARPFGGLVYRQAIEHLHGVRDEPATRALIAQENRRYARRQLIWFRKEPNLCWLDGPGESAAAIDSVQRLIDQRRQEREH